MGAVSDKLESDAVAGSDVETALSELDLDGIPKEYDRSLVHQNGSLRMAVPPAAFRPAGHSLDDPGNVVAYHFKQLDMMVVDLNP